MKEMQQARETTLSLLEAFTQNFPKDTAWRDQFPWINPPLWEFGHIAWFQEFWLLRQTAAPNPARDELYNSAEISRESRWTMDAVEAAEVQDDLLQAADRCEQLLYSVIDDETDNFYFFRLVLAHEHMHIESLLWVAQSLGFSPEATASNLPLYARLSEIQSNSGTISIPAQQISVTATPEFHFDNEAPGQFWLVEAFDIDAAPVSHGQYAAFVDAGGYLNAGYWSDGGKRWLSRLSKPQPMFWRVTAQGVERQWFGEWAPVQASSPMLHISYFEAEAYCRWAQRQLPSEAQWLAGAQADMIWGSAWEWLSDMHLPFPGFKPHAYREYSEPWFGNHRLLKGGSLLASRLLHHPHYRNFFMPNRVDVSTGFRTVSSP
jgi:ergothioneine biosynthesis protein EgtB